MLGVLLAARLGTAPPQVSDPAGTPALVDRCVELGRRIGPATPSQDPAKEPPAPGSAVAAKGDRSGRAPGSKPGGHGSGSRRAPHI